jgi:hypothetical protein
MKKILTIFFSVCCLQVLGQKNLVHENWHGKIDAALYLIKQYEPVLFEQTVRQAYIQLSDCSKQGMAAFATKDYRVQETIEWIMIDVDQADKKSIKNLASLIVHEALHLKRWYHSNTGKTWGTMTPQERDQEHTYIFNYQLSFLKKIGANKSDISYYVYLMASLGLPIYK